MGEFNDLRSRRDRYEALRSSLWRNRSSFDSHWKEIADFIQPRRQRFNNSDHNTGDKRNQNIINSTARFASRTLSSGLHAGLTSPARPWFKLGTPDPDLAKFGPVKQWLHEVTKRMEVVFNTTNLYNVLPLVYGDLGLFGTGAMGVMDDSKDLFRCYSYAIGTYAIGLDARGLATTFVRMYRMSVRQLIQEFALDENQDINWSVLSPTVKALWEQSNYEAPVDVIHVVCPNENHTKDRLGSKYLAWASCYYEHGSDSTHKAFLRESGYNEFPFMVPRWDVTDGDSYGTDCPGMTALGDVKQLQIMEKRKGQAIAKMVDPPLVGPPALRSQKTSLLPGDVTYIDVREGMQGLRSIHDVNLRIDHLTQDIGNVEYRIDRAFYADLFLMISRGDDNRGSQPVTAREIEERHEEKLLALGPVLERTNDELLDRLIDRVFYIMLRKNVLPPAPEQLQGVRLKVEYTSIMAQAQKLVGVVAQDRFINSTLSMAASAPSVLNKVVFNKAIDHYAEMYGMPPDMVRSDEEADAIAEAAANAEKEAMAAQQAKDMAGAMKGLAETPLEGDSALTRMMAGAGATVQ